MKNFILMGDYIPLGDTRYVFKISEYIILMEKFSIQIAIFRILVANSHPLFALIR